MDNRNKQAIQYQGIINRQKINTKDLENNFDKSQFNYDQQNDHLDIDIQNLNINLGNINLDGYSIGKNLVFMLTSNEEGPWFMKTSLIYDQNISETASIQLSKINCPNLQQIESLVKTGKGFYILQLDGDLNYRLFDLYANFYEIRPQYEAFIYVTNIFPHQAGSIGEKYVMYSDRLSIAETETGYSRIDDTFIDDYSISQSKLDNSSGWINDELNDKQDENTHLTEIANIVPQQYYVLLYNNLGQIIKSLISYDSLNLSDYIIPQIKIDNSTGWISIALSGKQSTLPVDKNGIRIFDTTEQILEKNNPTQSKYLRDDLTWQTVSVTLTDYSIEPTTKLAKQADTEQGKVLYVNNEGSDQNTFILQDLTTIIQNAINSYFPIGHMILLCDGATVPDNYVKCDGSIYNLADYSAFITQQTTNLPSVSSLSSSNETITFSSNHGLFIGNTVYSTATQSGITSYTNYLVSYSNGTTQIGLSTTPVNMDAGTYLNITSTTVGSLAFKQTKCYTIYSSTQFRIIDTTGNSIGGGKSNTRGASNYQRGLAKPFFDYPTDCNDSISAPDTHRHTMDNFCSYANITVGGSGWNVLFNKNSGLSTYTGQNTDNAGSSQYTRFNMINPGYWYIKIQ